MPDYTPQSLHALEAQVLCWKGPVGHKCAEIAQTGESLGDAWRMPGTGRGRQCACVEACLSARGAAGAGRLIQAHAKGYQGPLGGLLCSHQRAVDALPGRHPAEPEGLPHGRRPEEATPQLQVGPSAIALAYCDMAVG